MGGEGSVHSSTLVSLLQVFCGELTRLCGYSNPKDLNLNRLLISSSQSDKVLSFVPPDGNFRLISYHLSSSNIVAIPVSVRHLISFKEAGGGRLDVTLGPRQTMGRVVSYLPFNNQSEVVVSSDQSEVVESKLELKDSKWYCCLGLVNFTP